MNASESENHGLAVLNENDLMVYSVGISTGGTAEIRMAQTNPKRHIIATTIHEKGIEESKKFISEKGLEKQIELKLEDVSSKLPYADAHFDFIYARLVLHYLSRKKLMETLKELHRILKTGSKIYVVVRSVKCEDANKEGKIYDEATGLTAYPQTNPSTGERFISSRFFHTEESISEYIKQAGFDIAYNKSYSEQLTMDFMRTQPSDHFDEVIEVLGIKD